MSNFVIGQRKATFIAAHGIEPLSPDTQYKFVKLTGAMCNTIYGPCYRTGEYYTSGVNIILGEVYNE